MTNPWKFLDRAVQKQTTPGGILLIGNLRREIVVPFGTLRYGDAAVTPDTVYDIASLTKVVATGAIIMRLCERTSLTLEHKLGELVPRLAGQLGRPTISHALAHAAGFQAHIPFFEELENIADANARRTGLFERAAMAKRIGPPGAQTRYSDLGHILLGHALETFTNSRLDALVSELVCEPLGMNSTFYVDLTATPQPTRPNIDIAPTEDCPRRGLLVGQVHDDNAHAAGGVCGHAGLFSTAPDLARFARALLSAHAGTPGVFAPAIVRHMFGTHIVEGSSWRIGWDTPSTTLGISHAGDAWPRSGVGHLGFTGCSIWLDLEQSRFAILLTNRVHPSRDGDGIKELRRQTMDTACAIMDVAL